MKGGFLGLKDDEGFWRRPLARQDRVLDRLLDRRPGLLLDAPCEVELPLRQSLPAVVGLVATYEQLHGLDPGRAGALAAVNVETSEVWAGTLEDLDGVEPPDDPGPPPATKGTGALVLLACARARTGLAWTPGASYLLSAHLRERASNRVPVRLVPGPQVYVDPAARALVLARRRAHALRHSPVGPLAEGGLDLGDPAAKALVPERPGLAARAERVVVMDPGAPAVLRVGLRAALRPWERARPARPGDPDLDARVSGVVPVTLLVTGALDAAPRVLALRVPVEDPLPHDLDADALDPDADGPEVALAFALDLLRLDGFPRAPGTYYVSVFSGEHMAGPAPVALVSPLSLRAP
ncbi:MAG: hypothetical protein KF878_11795 [Planctomycetes bacterium]|nr:hypothetical protein [Planctomycetota bacterium]